MLKDFMGKLSLPELKDGEHSITISGYSYTADKKGNADNDYLAFTYTRVDGREIKDNRFERGLAVMISQIRRQTGDEATYSSPMELIDKLIREKTPLKIWTGHQVVISKLTGEAKRVSSLEFLEPLAVVKEDQTTATSEEKPF